MAHTDDFSGSGGHERTDVLVAGGSGGRSPAEPSCSLDALETTEQLVPSASASRRRLFGDDLALANRVGAALDVHEGGRWAKRVSRLYGCCSVPMMGVASSGKPVLSLGRCRDRMCPFCARIRCRQVARRVSALLALADAPKMITLTLADDGGSLSSRMARLIDSFRELRRRMSWRERVAAGVAAIEVTRGSRGDHWHVHLHALVDASYYPQDLLSDEWLSITGDSRIVDIRPVYDRAKTVTYVSKYVAKPGDLKKWDGDELRNYAEGMHRRRSLITFGAWHNLATDTDEPEPHDAVLSEGCSVGKIRWAARAGCRDAIKAQVLAAKAGGLWARAMGVPATSPGRAAQDPMTDEHWLEFGRAIEAVRRWDPYPKAPRPPRRPKQHPPPKLWPEPEIKGSGCTGLGRVR